jgi:hypothetical protein
MAIAAKPTSASDGKALQLQESNGVIGALASTFKPVLFGSIGISADAAGQSPATIE